MKRTATFLVFSLAAAAWLLREPAESDACALVRPIYRPNTPPYKLEIAEESAIIVWEAATKTQHFIRRASFKSEAADFGFLVPTPARPELAEGDDRAFSYLEKLTAPPIRWVYSSPVPMSSKVRAPAFKAAPPPPVVVLETKRVAGFDAAVLEARDAAALNQWLKKHGYQSSPDLVNWLDFYVKAKWKITAFKIAKDDKGNRLVATSAVRMSFKTERPFFPYREPAEPPPPPETATEKGEEPKIVRRTPGARLLRVYFLGSERVQGQLGDKEWPGKTVWANKVYTADRHNLFPFLKLDLPTDKDWWLTELEDRSSPRPGTDDVYFDTAKDQAAVSRPALIRYAPRPPVPPKPPRPKPPPPKPKTPSPFLKLEQPSRAVGGEANVTVPPEWRDAAFDRFVDPPLLLQAWEEFDAALMTDLALQLLEGERVLKRPHKTFPAEKVFFLAMAMAAESVEPATLARLAKAADLSNRKSLMEQAATAQKLLGASRSPPVFADDLSPEDHDTYQAHLRTFRQAKLLGRKDLLEGLAQSVGDLKGLTDRQRVMFRRQCAETAAAPPTPHGIAQMMDRWLERN